jgi:hypothetical protein
MPAPQNPRFAKFNQSTIVAWDDGSYLTGFILIGLVLPTGYQQGFYAAYYPSVAVPTFLKVPIVNGTYNGSAGVLYNEDAEPPHTRYISWLYDATGQQIAGPSSFFTVNSATFTPPTLVAPTPASGSIPPVPNSGPQITTNMPIYYNGGYFNVPYAATLNLDLANALAQECEATGNLVLSTPIYTGSAIVPGILLSFKLIQDSTGGRTLTFGAIFEGVTNMEPDLTPNTYTQYVFIYTTSSKWSLLGMIGGMV